MKRSFGKSVCAGIALVALTMHGTMAHAYTECTVSPTSVYAGDDGTVWLTFSNGGQAYILSSDPDFKLTFALATTAVAASMQVTARYAGDGISCTSLQPLIGLKLLL
jgi:hypothetical protein